MESRHTPWVVAGLLIWGHMRKIIALASGLSVAVLVLSSCGARPGVEQRGNADTGALKILADEVGATSAAKRSVHVAISMFVDGKPYAGAGDLRLGADPAMHLTMSVPELGGELTILLVDKVLYFSAPKIIQSGKRWVRMASTVDNPTGNAFGAALKQLLRQGDPAQVLKQFGDAGRITATRPEESNGKSTTHYSVTIDVDKLASGQQDADLRQLVNGAQQAGAADIPLEVWLDQESLPVRMTMDTPFRKPDTNHGDKLTITADYSDWGRAVEVTAPPANEVAELPR